MIWYNKSWFQIIRSWFDIINPDFKSCIHDLIYNRSWFQIMHSWFNLISYDLTYYMIISDTGNSQTCWAIYQGQSLLPCLRRSKGLSTRLHRVSQSHQLAQPLPQVQPPSPQRAPLRLLKSYVNVLACNRIMLHFSGDSSGFK